MKTLRVILRHPVFYLTLTVGLLLLDTAQDAFWTVWTTSLAVGFASLAGYLLCDQYWSRHKRFWQIPDEAASRWLTEMCTSDPWILFAQRMENLELTERTFELITKSMALALRCEENRLNWKKTLEEINKLLDDLKAQDSSPPNAPEPQHHNEAKRNQP